VRCAKQAPFSGDFVFAIWDGRQQQFFAARDQMGTHPFNYAFVENTLIFSNEMMAIRQHPAVSMKLDEYAIADFLLFGGFFWFDRRLTIFSDIRMLEAAHQLTADHGSVQTERYWQLPYDEPMLRYRTEQEYADHFLDLFKITLKDRARTDRVVVSMSGGLDSTSIAAMLSQLVQQGEINTQVSAVVGVYDRIHPDTEAYYARLVGLRYPNTLHIEFMPLDQYGITNPFPVASQPSFDMQKDQIEGAMKVILRNGRIRFAGGGGDELFVETPLWDTMHAMPPLQALEMYRWLWGFLGHRPPLWGLLPYLQEHLKPRRQSKLREEPTYNFPIWLNPEFIQRLDLKSRWRDFWNLEVKPTAIYQPNVYQGFVTNDWTMHGELMDRLAYTPPMPARPFLDIRMIRFALSLPPQPFNRRKYLLRRAMRDILPEEVLKRPKTPLGSLITNLLREPGLEWIDQWEAIPELAPYVRRELVQPVVNKNYPNSLGQVYLRPMMLNHWMKALYERARQPQIPTTHS